MQLFAVLSTVSVVAAGLWGCSDDGEAADGGHTSGDAVADGPRTDSGKKGLPATYKPYDCSKPGLSCNAHDPCAVNPVCGTDKKCWPEYLMDCDDGLACTVDSCAGLGMCTHLPKKGYCMVGVQTQTDDSGVPETVFKCVTSGTRNPADPCMACSPTESDGGTTDNTKWMPVSGGSCDDKESCTKNDTCTNGICKGTYFGSQCADGYGCTDDICDGKGGCLGNTLKTGWCLINGTCYKDTTKHPQGSCFFCSVKDDVTDWTAIKDSCYIGSKCYSKGEKHTGGCAECDPAASATSWTVKGSYCLISNVCKNPNDKDPTACGQCDPTKDKYGWTAIAGLCNINGTCYTSGTKNTGKCAECDPTASATSWTVKGQNCLIDDTCKNPGDKDTIACSKCDPTASKYSWTPLAGKCLISGSCYASGDAHPQGCAVCAPAQSATSWTMKPAVSKCLINNVCVKSGDKDLSGCGTCDPTQTQYAWTALPGLCTIDGKCYKQGESHPKGCGTCDPTKSASAWTVQTGKCLIEQVCYASGAKHSTSCGTCDPTQSQTAWTVSGQSCLIGDSCLSSGTVETGGCGVCDVKKSKVGWTKPSGCLAAHAYSKGFGSTSSDYGYGLGTDANGNVYIAGYYYYNVSFGGGVTHTSNGSYDIFIASFTPSGQYRWSKSFGGTSSDYIYDLAVDSAGNVYVTGSYYTSINLGGSALTAAGSQDMFVASYDSAGNHRWSKGFGGSSYDYGYGIAVDSAGNSYVTGYFYTSIDFGGGTLYANGSSYDVFLASFTTTGKHRWSKVFGGTSSDYGYGLAVDASGNSYITGYYYGTVSFGGTSLTSSSGDIFLASYTTAGTHRWSKGLGGTSSDYGYGLATDPSGNVYVTGYFYNSVDFGSGTSLSSAGSSDIFLASYTTAGVYRWAKALGGTSYDYGYGVATDSSGNVYVTGAYYGSADFGGGTLTSNGSNDIYIAAYNPSGVHLWSRSHGGTSSDYGRKVAVDGSGNTYVTGYYYGGVDFGGGALTNAGSYDVFLLKLAP